MRIKVSFSIYLAFYFDIVIFFANFEDLMQQIFIFYY